MAQSISQEAIGATGLPGATAASRHAGATASGAPVSGTFAVGDFIIDQTGKVYVCTVAGTPGTWTQVGGGASLTYASSYITSNQLTSSNVYKAITSLSLAAGTWLINAQLSVQNTGASEYNYWIGPTSASYTSAYAGQTSKTATANAWQSNSFSYILTLGSTTTVYFNYISTSAGSIQWSDDYLGTTGNATGINAVKIA